MDILTFWS